MHVSKRQVTKELSTMNFIPEIYKLFIATVVKPHDIVAIE